MFDTQLDTIRVAVGVAIALAGIARLHTSPQMWSPNRRSFWNPLRRYVWPPIDRAVASVPFLYAKTSVTESEVIVDGAELDLEELVDRLEAAGYEAQPLASIAYLDVPGAFGDGELERLSAARYHGGRLGEAVLPEDVLELLPDWLVRRRQVHVRPFGPDGRLTITAHDELNPWNPVFALPHFLGMTLDADRGVRLAAEDLGLEDHVGDVGAAEVVEA